jgi:hypothetical protein
MHSKNLLNSSFFATLSTCVSFNFFQLHPTIGIPHSLCIFVFSLLPVYNLINNTTYKMLVLQNYTSIFLDTMYNKLMLQGLIAFELRFYFSTFSCKYCLLRSYFTFCLNLCYVNSDL